MSDDQQHQQDEQEIQAPEETKGEVADEALADVSGGHGWHSMYGPPHEDIEQLDDRPGPIKIF
jgi:hypothetical protein